MIYEDVSYSHYSAWGTLKIWMGGIIGFSIVVAIFSWIVKERIKNRTMKKIILGLIVLVLVGCSEKRILVDNLTKTGEIYYYESKLYNGVMFNVYDNDQLKEEANIKDEKENGLYKSWHQNGQLKKETNFRMSPVMYPKHEYFRTKYLNFGGSWDMLVITWLLIQYFISNLLSI